MSRKKIEVRAAVALVAFAVVLVTGGVLYAQSGSPTEDASLVLSRPNMLASTPTAAASDQAPTAGPTVTASPAPAKKAAKKKAAPKAT